MRRQYRRLDIFAPGQKGDEAVSFTVHDLLEEAKGSRRYFLKHVKGLTAEQWDWKPYPECKSVRETVAHLISDDRADVHPAGGCL